MPPSSTVSEERGGEREEGSSANKGNNDCVSLKRSGNHDDSDNHTPQLSPPSLVPPATKIPKTINNFNNET